MQMMNKVKVMAFAATAALAGFASAASAEEREFSYSFNIGGYSDYIFRGLSLSGEQPVVQGGIDIGWGSLYAGVWATDLGEYASGGEIDLYAGYKPTWQNITFDFGVVQYTYTDNNGNLTYTELKTGASSELAKGLTAGVIVWYQLNNSNVDAGLAVEGSLAYALPAVGPVSPTVSALLGHQQLDAFDDYWYWNAGLTLGIEKLAIDLRYWDTDINQNSAFAAGDGDSRFVASVKVTLP